MLFIQKFIFSLSNLVGHFASALLILLVCNVAFDVFTRYVLNDVSIGMQELEWHIFATIFLFGISYTFTEDAHVRVDFLYMKAKPEIRSIIDIVGIILFVLPFAILIFWYAVDFTIVAFERGEQSGDPGGLPYRWIIKSTIAMSALLLILSSSGVALERASIFFKNNK